MKLNTTTLWVVLASLLLSTPIEADQAFDHQHQLWTQLLQRHVKVINQGQASEVDYAAIAKDRKILSAYLDQLSGVSSDTFDAFSKAEKKAFLINAYNAFTIQLILTRYPDIDSIKDLGGLFRSPWKQAFIPLLGQILSLDQIEHERLRKPGRYDDPRIHFAVNCASIGCPPLREEAFVSAELNQQLDEQAQRFLSDRNRNRYDRDAETLQVSKIFDWYGDDFNKGYQGIESLSQFFAGYADLLADAPVDKNQIRQQNADIEFLDYDWRLNDIRR